MWRRTLLALLLVGATGSVLAIDYRSVDVPAAILYDVPSQKGKKLYLIKARTPVEVVVQLDGWFKVRDAEGSLTWIEPNQLSDRRTLIVTAATAEIHQAAQPDSPVLRQLEKWVAVDLLDAPSPGWAKVRLSDGTIGYVQAKEVWGL